MNHINNLTEKQKSIYLSIYLSIFLSIYQSLIYNRYLPNISNITSKNWSILQISPIPQKYFTRSQ